MCVDTHRFRCCCGLFSLTTATLIIGTLYLIGAIVNAIQGIWAAFAFDLAFVALFAIVVFKPYNEGVRKLIYYLFMILAVVSYTAFFIFIIIAFTGDWEVQWCNAVYTDYDQYYSNFQDCVNFINTILIVAVVAALVVSLPCTLCIL